MTKSERRCNFVKFNKVFNIWFMQKDDERERREKTDSLSSHNCCEAPYLIKFNQTAPKTHK